MNEKDDIQYEKGVTRMEENRFVLRPTLGKGESD